MSCSYSSSHRHPLLTHIIYNRESRVNRDSSQIVVVFFCGYTLRINKTHVVVFQLRLSNVVLYFEAGFSWSWGGRCWKSGYLVQDKCHKLDGNGTLFGNITPYRRFALKSLLICNIFISVIIYSRHINMNLFYSFMVNCN